MTEASTGAWAGGRTEIRRKESADSNEFVVGHYGGFDGSLGRDPDGDSLEGIGGRCGEFDEGLDGDFDGSLGMGPD